jgi:hypothetical protein
VDLVGKKLWYAECLCLLSHVRHDRIRTSLLSPATHVRTNGEVVPADATRFKVAETQSACSTDRTTKIQLPYMPVIDSAFEVTTFYRNIRFLHILHLL